MPAAGAPFEYLGRIDAQIKILGHRVELEEVEAVLREEARADAIAVGWPPTPSGAAGIVAFIADLSLDTIGLRRALSARLPDYMVPRELRLVKELPLNAKYQPIRFREKQFRTHRHGRPLRRPLPSPHSSKYAQNLGCKNTKYFG